MYIAIHSIYKIYSHFFVVSFSQSQRITCASPQGLIFYLEEFMIINGYTIVYNTNRVCTHKLRTENEGKKTEIKL